MRPTDFELHSRHLNNMMVRVLKTIGFDVRFVSGKGAHLVGCLGRALPRPVERLGRVSDRAQSSAPRRGFEVGARQRPAQSRADGRLRRSPASSPSGCWPTRPGWKRSFFANSGAEAFEAAVKFARAATGRAGIVHCEHSFHGLTYGALSAIGDEIFRDGFGPLLPGFVADPVRRSRRARTRARAARRRGVLRRADPGQGGEHALARLSQGRARSLQEIRDAVRRRRDPDRARPNRPFLRRRALGRGARHDPDRQGALGRACSGRRRCCCKSRVFAKVFDRMDKAVVHGSTFAKNDLAMAAGIATLEVIEDEKLVENAATQGRRLMASLEAMQRRYELIKDVRGKGLMIGLELGEPRSLKLRASWALLETMNKGLFCQLVTIPLFRDHKILVQVAGHANRTIKLLPALVIDADDCAVDRECLRRGDRRQPQRRRAAVVARQDAGRRRAIGGSGRLGQDRLGSPRGRAGGVRGAAVRTVGHKQRCETRAELVATSQKRPESDQQRRSRRITARELERACGAATAPRRRSHRAVRLQAEFRGGRQFSMGGIGDDPHRNERHAEFVGKNRGLKRFHIHGRGAGSPVESTLIGRVKHRIGDGDDVAQFGAGRAVGEPARPFDIGLDAPTAGHHACRDDPISRHQVRTRPPAMPKLRIAGAPAKTALLMAWARSPTFPPHANTLTPGAEAILASALSPVMTINKTPCPIVLM